MNYVYHASEVSGLTKLEPRVSTHGESWVYAMEKSEYALMFLGNHSDLINQIGFVDGVAQIVERFPGALEYGYKDVVGSVYKLDAKDFKAGMTSFNAELVCDHVCAVQEEIEIQNALERILELESDGRIIIYRYPSLPAWMPNDKSDLIEKVVRWAQKPGSTILKRVEELHPDILDVVKQRLHTI